MDLRTSKMAKSVKYKAKELEIHSDQRGWLVEMLKKNELRDEIKQIYVATIKPGCIRGNHYHLRRTEWFFISEGEIKLYLKDIKTGKKIYLKLSGT